MTFFVPFFRDCRFVPFFGAVLGAFILSVGNAPTGILISLVGSMMYFEGSKSGTGKVATNEIKAATEENRI
jgi:hypothetical protein